MAVHAFDQFSMDKDSKHHYIKRGKTAVYWGLPRRNPHGERPLTDDEMTADGGSTPGEPWCFCDGTPDDRREVIEEADGNHYENHKIYEPPLSLHLPDDEWYILEVEE